MRIVKNGDVHVSAPRGLSRANIETFINENRKWIAETREKTFEYERKRAEFYNRLPLKTQEERDDALQRLQARQQLVLGMGTQAGQQPEEEQEGMV